MIEKDTKPPSASLASASTPKALASVDARRLETANKISGFNCKFPLNECKYCRGNIAILAAHDAEVERRAKIGTWEAVKVGIITSHTLPTLLKHADERIRQLEADMLAAGERRQDTPDQLVEGGKRDYVDDDEMFITKIRCRFDGHASLKERMDAAKDDLKRRDAALLAKHDEELVEGLAEFYWNWHTQTASWAALDDYARAIQTDKARAAIASAREKVKR